MRRLWRRLKAGLGPAPIETPEALKAFLEERAALIAQKCATDYCRGKTGLASYALFTEQPFLRAFDVCRWETYATVLADLLLLVEGRLRPHVGAEQHAHLCTALAAVYSKTLSAMPALAHRPQGWQDAFESFAVRVQGARQRHPPRALDVADHSAKRLFDTLPIHISMRELDQEVVYGAVRFRMIAVNQELERRLAAPELARQLIG